MADVNPAAVDRLGVAATGLGGGCLCGGFYFGGEVVVALIPGVVPGDAGSLAMIVDVVIAGAMTTVLVEIVVAVVAGRVTIGCDGGRGGGCRCDGTNCGGARRHHDAC